MEPRRIRLDLRVSPGAARSAVVGRYGQAWKLRVAAPPEGGRANASVVELLATSLDVRRPDVRIVAGAGSRDKVVEISGLTLEEAERRLDLSSCSCANGSSAPPTISPPTMRATARSTRPRVTNTSPTTRPISSTLRSTSRWRRTRAT
jgi:uncharacterized protein (TIGR00251 family)